MIRQLWRRFLDALGPDPDCLVDEAGIPNLGTNMGPLGSDLPVPMKEEEDCGD